MNDLPGADTLVEVLLDAQRVGDLGPAPVEQHIAHSRRLAEALAPPPEWFVDLGTGAGIPGLVLLLAWPEARAVFVDASTARMHRLTERLDRLGLRGRSDVVAERAETVGHGPRRGTAGLVLARAFGAPPVVAECGAALLAPAGRLVVSEPPEPDPDRWPAAGLASLGLAREDDIAGWACLRRVAEVPDRFPRRTGVPARRPLW